MPQTLVGTENCPHIYREAEYPDAEFCSFDSRRCRGKERCIEYQEILARDDGIMPDLNKGRCWPNCLGWDDDDHGFGCFGWCYIRGIPITSQEVYRDGPCISKRIDPNYKKGQARRK